MWPRGGSESFNEPNWTQPNQTVGAGGVESKLGYKELWLLPLPTSFSYILSFTNSSPQTNKWRRTKTKTSTLYLPISWSVDYTHNPRWTGTRAKTAQGSGIRFDLSSLLKPFSLAHVSQGAVQPPPLSLRGPSVPAPDAGTWATAISNRFQLSTCASQSLPVQKLLAVLSTPLPLKNKEPWELLLM